MRGAGIEPLVRDALMAVRREAERDLRERLAAFGRELGWERDGEVGALEEVLLLGEEVVQNVGEGRIGGAEAGGEEVLQRAGDLVGYDGGGHGVVAGLAAWCGGRWWHRLVREAEVPNCHTPLIRSAVRLLKLANPCTCLQFASEPPHSVLDRTHTAQRGNCMPDNKRIRQPHDRKRIDINDPSEVRNWCRRLQCTKGELEGAVKAVGTSASEVQKWLKDLKEG